MKISGGDHLVVTHTWSKNYFSNIKLTGLKVDCPKMPLSQNAPVSPKLFLMYYKDNKMDINNKSKLTSDLRT